MRNTTFVIAALLALVLSSLNAQDASSLQIMSPEQAKLSFLVGTFTTETQVMPGPMSPKGSKGTGSSILTWGLDSMFVMLDEQSMNPVFGNYKGHGMLGFNKREGKYVLSMFNNFGDTPQYRGNFSGDTLTLTTKVEFPHGAFEQKLVWFKESNTVRLKIFNDMGKGPMLTIDQTYVPSVQTNK